MACDKLFDALSARVRNLASRCVPHGILGVEFDALIDALGVLFFQMHGNEVERVLALLLIGLRLLAPREKLLDRLA